jgi:hypothetical protein
MHRNLTTLRDLQAERKRNYERDKKDEVLIARLHEFNDMPIQASATPSKNGFLFSNEEIAIRRSPSALRPHRRPCSEGDQLQPAIRHSAHRLRRFPAAKGCRPQASLAGGEGRNL